MRHSIQEWRVFCICDFVMFYRQMILFFKKNVHFICICNKKIVTLQDNLISFSACVRMGLQIK